jgi:uncharacterized protein (TIGR00251 family)
VKEHWYYWRGETLYLKVHVSPQNRHDEIGDVSAGRLRIRLKSPPVDGKANKQLIGMMASEFNAGKSRVRIATGARGRDKVVAIENPGCIPAWLASRRDYTS